MSAPAGTVRVTFKYTSSVGGEADVVWHFWHRDGIDPDVTDLGDLLANLHDWAIVSDYDSDGAVSWMAQFNQHTTMVEIHAQTLAVPPVGADVGINTSGSNTGSALPVETAMVTTWRTAFLGRSYRGRSFWPGIDPDTLDTNGELASSNAVIFHTIAQALVDHYLADSVWMFCVYSPTLGAVTEITHVSVQPTLHHQSRRNP